MRHLLKPHYDITDVEEHRTEFIQAITENPDWLIAEQPINYNATYFYYYLKQYCPEKYILFLPALIGDIDVMRSSYINDTARSLFLQLGKDINIPLAYQVLQGENFSHRIRKVMLEFLYDELVEQVLQENNLTYLDEFKSTLQQLYKTCHPKIGYDIGLYLLHLDSYLHQQHYIESLPEQPTLFQHNNFIQRKKNRIYFSLYYLIPIYALNQLKDVDQLSPETVIILLQLAVDHYDTTIRHRCQSILAQHPQLVTHLIYILTSHENKYKKPIFQLLLIPECRITITYDDLVKIIKKDQAQQFSHYIYQLFIRYQYDLTGYFDKQSIQNNAEKHLNKIPVSLQWLNIEDLPELYWQEDQSPIDKKIVYAWLCQAAKITDLRHHESFRLYLDFLTPKSQSIFSDFIMKKFIERDLQQSAAKCKGILVFSIALPFEQHIAYIEDYFKQAQQHVPQLKAMLETLLRSDEESEYLIYLLDTKTFRRKPVINEYRYELLQHVATDLGLRDAPNLKQYLTPRLDFALDQPIIYHYQDQDYLLNIENCKAVLTHQQLKKINKLPKAKNPEQQVIFDEVQAKIQAVNDLFKIIKSQYRSLLYPCVLRVLYDEWQNLFFQHPILRHFAYAIIWDKCPHQGYGQTIQCVATKEGQFMDINHKILNIQPTDRFAISERANFRQDWEKWLPFFQQQQRFHLYQKV